MPKFHFRVILFPVSFVWISVRLLILEKARDTARACDHSRCHEVAEIGQNNERDIALQSQRVQSTCQYYAEFRVIRRTPRDGLEEFWISQCSRSGDVYIQAIPDIFQIRDNFRSYPQLSTSLRIFIRKKRKKPPRYSKHLRKGTRRSLERFVDRSETQFRPCVSIPR